MAAITRVGLTGPMTAYGTFSAKEETVVFYPVVDGGYLILGQLQTDTLAIVQVATGQMTVTQLVTQTVRID